MTTIKEKNKIKFVDHLAIKEKGWKLKKAHDFVVVLDKIQESLPEKAKFLQNLQEVIDQKAQDCLDVNALEKAAKQIPMILVSQIPYLYKLASVEAFLSGSFNNAYPKLYEEIKKVIIKKGDFELYHRLMDATNDSLNTEELKHLGENAIKAGSSYDASKAFASVKDLDGLSEAKKIEKTKIEKAEEKLKEMPQGFKTNGLTMHRTEYRFVENILQEGVLSLVQQFQKYGISPEKKREPFNHGLRGSYDYVSIMDPWYGSETASDFLVKKKEIRDAIKNEVSSFMVKMDEIPYDKKKCNDLAEKYFAIWQDDSKPADFYITFEAAIHPKWQNTMAKIENIFEQYSEVKIDTNKTEAMRYPKGKSSQKINLTAVFIPDRGGIGLLLNPKLKRFSVLSGGCNFESLAKKSIQPKNILGILIGNEFFSEIEEEKQEDILKYMKKIAQLNGLPLYKVSVKRKISLIWPKK